MPKSVTGCSAFEKGSRPRDYARAGFGSAGDVYEGSRTLSSHRSRSLLELLTAFFNLPHVRRHGFLLKR